MRHDCEEATRLLTAVRADLGKDTKACDDLKRYLVALHEEEQDLRKGEEALKATHNAMRKNIEDMTAELDTVRLCSERERRALADLKVRDVSL